MKYLFYSLVIGLSLSLVACKTTSSIVKNNNSTKVLEKPPFSSYYQSTELQQKIAKIGESAQALELSLVKENVQDSASMAQWLKDNNITLPYAVYHDGAMTTAFRKAITQDSTLAKYQKENIAGTEIYLAHSVVQDNNLLLFYGSAPNELHVIEETWLLIVRDAKTLAQKFVFDFSNYKLAPEYIQKDKNFVKQSILWAQIEDGILYVSHSHLTYAQSSRGMNAYITAIDLRQGSIYWRSQPLVCNSLNFIVKGDYIYSTYGFNREGSEVFVLHKNTGKIVSKLDIEPKSSDKKYISLLFDKGNELYLYSYNKTYVVKIN